MQHPLMLLLKLQARSVIRRMMRGIKTPRGVLFFMLALVAIVLWATPNIFVVLFAERNSSDAARAIIPLALLTIFVFSVASADSDRAVYFSPAEIDFLFPGPFSRRDLLSYKLGKTMSGVPLTAVCFTALCLRHVAWWFAALLGFMLTLVFVQLVRVLLVLIGRTMTEHAFARLRKLLLITVAILLLASLAETLFATNQAGPIDVAEGIRHSLAGALLLAVFDIFALTIAAAHFSPDLVQWGALALAIDLLLMLFILRLDTASLEASLAMSQKIQDREQRLRRSGGLMAVKLHAAARWRLPLFPRMGGTGCIAWRQLTDALRSVRGLLGLLFVMAVSVGPILLVGSRRGGGAGSIAGGLIWMTVFVPMMFRFDFRRDMDHMDWLKMLPLRPTAIVLGELIPPVTITIGLQLFLVGGVLPFARDSRFYVLTALLFVLPFNVLLFGIENLLFLLFPVRVTGLAVADVQSFGRQMGLSLAKILMLAPCCASAIVLGALAYSLANESWLAFGIVAWSTLALEAAAVVPCVAWAFRRFDLSLDTPP